MLSAKQKSENTYNWTTKEIESVAPNPPGLKPGQVVLSSDLWTLHYHLDDMRNLTPKIHGDMTFPR
jgi:hypothetical protein